MISAIIPARGGSKGILGKNLKEINGIPLLGYPIIAAKDSKYISEVYVSTDSEDIKSVALKYGAKVIDRPKELAGDHSLDIDVMKHAVEYLNLNNDIAHLRATTPMIQSKVLDEAIEFYNDNTACTSLRSAHEASETAYKSFKLPKTYQANGYIDIIKPKQFMDSESLHGDKILAFITEYTHEVDTLMDFKVLQVLYDKNKK